MFFPSKARRKFERVVATSLVLWKKIVANNWVVQDSGGEIIAVPFAHSAGRVIFLRPPQFADAIGNRVAKLVKDDVQRPGRINGIPTTAVIAKIKLSFLREIKGISLWYMHGAVHG